MAIVLGVPRAGRVPISASFYDDVCDVVEELIQTGVTTSVVGTTARGSSRSCASTSGLPLVAHDGVRASRTFDAGIQFVF